MIHYDLLNNREFIEKYFKGQAHFSSKKLAYSVIKNGIILPHRSINGRCCGGVVADGKYISSTSLHYGFGEGYNYSEENVVYSDETVIYLGMFFSVWGHCITDNIRRLWFLKTKIFKERYSNCKLIYLPLGNFKFQDSFIRLLELMGFDYKQFIPVTEITCFSNVILPDECFYTDGKQRYFTEEYRDLICSVKKQAKIASDTEYEKIYFTYSHFTKNNNKVIGEEKLEAFFKSLGYKIIAPEEYSLDEQLSMLARCKHFASTEGSCAHNMIFLSENSEVIIIPRANYLTGYQLALNEVFNQNITYIDSSFSVFTNKEAPWHGPFFFYVSKNLYDYFGLDCSLDKKWWEENFGDFKLYYYNARLKAKNNNYPIEYYICSEKKNRKYIRVGFIKKLIYKMKGRLFRRKK